MSVDTGSQRRLERRYAGAPESLRRALGEASSDAALPRLTRRELGAAAEAVVLPASSVVGQIRFPAVVPGGDDGCIYLAVASEVVRSDLTPVPLDLAQRVQRFAAETWPRLSTRGLRLYLSGPGPGSRWSGRSCELALTVALLSAAVGVRPRPWVVLTGTVEGKGDCGPVDAMPEKEALVARDVPRGHLIDGGRPLDEVLSTALEPGWREAIHPEGERTARRMARRARAALDEHRYEEAERVAAEVLAMQAGVSARAIAWWVRGAVALHEGRADDGLAALDAVLALLPAWADAETSPPEAWAREEIVAWFLVGLMDAGRVRAALQRGEATIASMGSPARRDARWRNVMVQLAGSTARAAVAAGEFGVARRLLTEVCLGRAGVDQQRARCLGDLAEVHRKSGDLNAAKACLVEAREALLDMPVAGRPRTAVFLDLYEARIGGPVRRLDGIWPGRGFAVLEAERAGDVDTLLALTHQSAASFALSWVCVAAVSRVSDSVPRALRELLATWQVDDARLAELTMAATSGDVAAMRELGVRCPS